MPVEAGVVGVDEAGRGAWAGPLLVAAVGLSTKLPGLNDSKKLTSRQRAGLVSKIRKQAYFIGIGQSSPAEIDRHGLTKATALAMKRALKELAADYPIIIDGPFNFLPHRNSVTTQIDADANVAAVMAASIIAKVKRDQLMSAAAKRWPVYGFDRHVGYGTARHSQALQAYGICQIHRLSFKPIKSLVAKPV